MPWLLLATDHQAPCKSLRMRVKSSFGVARFPANRSTRDDSSASQEVRHAVNGDHPQHVAVGSHFPRSGRVISSLRADPSRSADQAG